MVEPTTASITDMTSMSSNAGTLENLLLTQLGAGKMGNIFGGNDNMGGGLIGGLILGSLLRNNGNLLGGADGAAGGAMLRTPPEQATANMSLMAGIGDVKQAVAVNAANADTSNAMQTNAISAQLSGVAAALTNTVTMAKDSASANAVTLMQQLNTVNTNIMESKFELAQVITNDGEKTRALITQNLVTDLNNQIADLRVQRTMADNGVTVTNNINQNQLQQQQQQQGILTNTLLQQLLAEQRITQGVLNIGSGTVSGNSQTAANTRVS